MQGELGGRVDQHVERAFVSRTPAVSAEVHHVRRVYDRQWQCSEFIRARVGQAVAVAPQHLSPTRDWTWLILRFPRAANSSTAAALVAGPRYVCTPDDTAVPYAVVSRTPSSSTW